MSQNNERYDQGLLDRAPTSTKEQRQGGYDVDILDSPPRAPSTQPIQLPPQQITPRGTDVESNSQEKIVPGAATPPARSFWRSRNGIIAIFVIILVILGAVIGGAVGGSVGKHAPTVNTAPKTTTSSTSSASIGIGGTGQASAAVGANNNGGTTTPMPTAK